MDIAKFRPRHFFSVSYFYKWPSGFLSCHNWLIVKRKNYVPFSSDKKEGVEEDEKTNMSYYYINLEEKILKLWKAGRIIETSLRINFD